MTPRSKAMDFLARREYGFEELCLRLSKCFESSADIRAAVITLQDEGLQSDERFAEALTQRRFNQGYGPNYVRRELSMKKIALHLIDDAVLKHNWEINIKNVVVKNAHKTTQQLQKYLQYKGYDFEMINRVTRS